MRVRAAGAALLIMLPIGACANRDDPSEAKATRSSATTSTTATTETTDTTETVATDATTATTAAGRSATTTTTRARASTATTASTETSAATDTTATSTSSDTTQTTSASTTTAGRPFQSQTNLRIQGNRFDPSDLVVAPRTRVTVTNADAVPHTWTSDSGEWNSGRIVAGGAFTHSFTRVGTFAYHCEIHPSMTGSVTVS